MLTLTGANRTAQWYEDTWLGALFAFLHKFLLHTTETKDWPGYGGGASAPNATYKPMTREIRQHFSSNRSSRALRDPSGTTVRENRDFVFQLEIIAYSDKALARSVGGLWIGDLTASHYFDIARIAIQLHDQLGLPLRQSVTWKEGTGSYYGGVRLTGPQYDAYQGILGHVHASGNTHWDPGGFFISRLMAEISRQRQAPTSEREMELTDKIALFPSDANVKYSGTSSTVGGILASTNYYTLFARNVALKNAAELAALKVKVDALAARVDIDPAELAAITAAADAGAAAALDRMIDDARVELVADDTPDA